MSQPEHSSNDHDYLRRLSAGAYQGRAFVHWSMTIEGRKKGWLKPIVYYKLREVLTHAAFRYSFCCPIYCLMPDHTHFMWVGFQDKSDQLLGARFFRKHMGPVLQYVGVEFQTQAYDRVLREDERQQEAFEDVVDYIARNPERANLVRAGEFQKYEYTGCLIPGYPTLKIWQAGFWSLFWRIHSRLSGRDLEGIDGEVE